MRESNADDAAIDAMVAELKETFSDMNGANDATVGRSLDKKATDMQEVVEGAFPARKWLELLDGEGQTLWEELEHSIEAGHAPPAIELDHIQMAEVEGSTDALWNQFPPCRRREILFSNELRQMASETKIPVGKKGGVGSRARKSERRTLYKKQWKLKLAAEVRKNERQQHLLPCVHLRKPSRQKLKRMPFLTRR